MKSYFLLLFFLITPLALSAQMFSVGGDSEESRRASSTYLRVGYAPVDFSFEGVRNPLNPFRPLGFEDPAINITIEAPVLSGSLSLINRITGSENNRYVNFSIDFNNRISFVRERRLQFGLPINVFTSLVNVQNEQQSNEFSQSTIGLGSGLYLIALPLNKVSLLIEGIPFYGFSNSDGGLFGGNNKGINASARLNFLNVFPGRSLSLGYDFKYSSYDIDGEEFDYDLSQHLITLGISL